MNWRGIVAAVFVAALSLVPITISASAHAADKAWDACAGEDPDKSIAGCTTVLKRGNKETQRDQARAYYNRGVAHFTKRDLDSALADYTKALELHPDYAFAFFMRGRVHGDRQEYGAAIADYSEAIRVDPTDPEAFYVRGNAYSNLKDSAKAIADYDEAVRLRPSYADAFFNRGNVYYDIDDYPLAIADYSASLGLNPNDASAYRNRANAYYVNKNYERAIADYDASLKIEPDNESAKSSRADAVAGLAAKESDKGETTAAAPDAAASAEAGGEASTGADKGSVVLNEKRVALVIGNSNYAAVGKLPNPNRDAEAVADALRAAGFEEVVTVDDLGRQDFLDALNSFAEKAANADWAVIYFAGHGIELDGINYLIPVDATLRTDRAIRDEAISLDRMIETVEGARKLRLIILDACRNNPFVAEMRVTGANRAIHRGLARVEPEGGTLVAYSAKGGQEAIDGDGTSNSPFAAALIKRLPTPGLEVDKMFRLVRDDVLAATGRKQEPFTYGSLPGETLSFVPQQ
ncbi:MAG: tetratricopeptide repeat protein [Bauldia sp.]